MKSPTKTRAVAFASFFGCAVLAGGTLQGCELLVDFDRTLIDGGGGGDATTGDASGDAPNDVAVISDASDGGGADATNDAGQDAGGDAGKTCAIPSDCTKPVNECIVATCTMNVCGTTNAVSGTPLAMQTPGTCKKAVCDGSGGTMQVNDNTNVPAATSDCVTPGCSVGAPTMTNVAPDTTCASMGGKVCNGAGSCVACVMASDCPSSPTLCATPACSSQTCAFANATLGTTCTDGGGTVCDGLGKCVSSHCSDGVKDGDETDKDCGGATCGACVDGKMCKLARDCSDKVCANGLCAAPTCSDGVQNGTETGIDCGGTVCDAMGKTCALGLGCVVSGDCGGNASCMAAVFTPAPTCNASKVCATMPTTCAGATPACSAASGCVACNVPTDCPATASECVLRTCTGSVCGTQNAASGTVLSMQTPGDCQKLVCNGAGGTTSVDDGTDLPTSTTLCLTMPACTGSPLRPSFTPAATGTNCTADNKPPRHVCGDTTKPAIAGTCVQCNANADCPMATPTCNASNVCQ